MLILIFGLPGTGKSYFAERLAEYLGVMYLNSDRIRQELQLQGKYGKEKKQKVYEYMLDSAEKYVQEGKKVILDATFSEPVYLQRAQTLAQQHGIACKLIEMHADEEVIRARVSQSRKYSEADYGVYQKLKEKHKTMDEAHLLLDTSHATAEQLIHQATKYLYHE